MPRITVNQTEIVVSFQHGTQPSAYNGKRPRPDVDYTKCIILAGPKGCRDEQKELVSATVVRYYRDPQNRKEARRNALARVFDNNPQFLNKDERAAVWETIRK